jgi:hypothetical protein
MLLNALNFMISTEQFMETETFNNYIKNNSDISKVTVSKFAICQV